MEPKPFPIMNPANVPNCPKSIPWDLLNEEWARRNHDQTTFTLARRGGLSACEALAIIERRPWKRMDDQEAVTKLLECFQSDAFSEHDK